MLSERISFGGVGVPGFALSGTEKCAVSGGGMAAIGSISALAAGALGAAVGASASKKHGALIGAIAGGALGSAVAATALDTVQHPDCGHGPGTSPADKVRIVAGSVLMTTVTGAIGAAAGRGVSKKKDRGTRNGALVGVALGGIASASVSSIFCWSCDNG